MKFSISIFRFLLLVIILISFSLVLLAQPIDLPPAESISIDWILQHWELILLFVSEILALLPGKHSGLLKILLFFFQRLKRVPASDSNSQSK